MNAKHGLKLLLAMLLAFAGCKKREVVNDKGKGYLTFVRADTSGHYYNLEIRVVGEDYDVTRTIAHYLGPNNSGAPCSEFICIGASCFDDLPYGTYTVHITYNAGSANGPVTTSTNTVTLNSGCAKI